MQQLLHRRHQPLVAGHQAQTFSRWLSNLTTDDVTSVYPICGCPLVMCERTANVGTNIGLAMWANVWSRLKSINPHAAGLLFCKSVKAHSREKWAEFTWIWMKVYSVTAGVLTSHEKCVNVLLLVNRERIRQLPGRTAILTVLLWQFDSLLLFIDKNCCC